MQSILIRVKLSISLSHSHLSWQLDDRIRRKIHFPDILGQIGDLPDIQVYGKIRAQLGHDIQYHCRLFRNFILALVKHGFQHQHIPYTTFISALCLTFIPVNNKPLQLPARHSNRCALRIGRINIGIVLVESNCQSTEDITYFIDGIKL